MVSPADKVTFWFNSSTVIAENVLALCVISSFNKTSSGTSLGSDPSATRPYTPLAFEPLSDLICPPLPA